MTEKSAKLIENNKYAFLVHTKLTKPQIKLIIEDLYKVKITSIQTNCFSKRKKKFKKFKCYKTKYKKAIIRIQPHESIQMLSTN